MRKGTASHTAMWVAAMRGLAGLDDRVIVDDPFAADLLPLGYRSVVRLAERSPRTSRIVLGGLARASGNLSRHLAFRTRAIDDVVSAEACAGVGQLVLLGAGFDARAWRLAALRDATVFEVDHPDTQESKRAAIGSRPALAKDVRWVPVNFATSVKLDDALAGANHDAAGRTTFVWEGVTMYLDGEDIDTTLAAVARRAARGSCLLMTYHDVAFRLESVVLTGMVRAFGEPFRTRMSPTDVRTRLFRHAFVVERDEGSDDWSQRYLGEPG